MRILGSLREVLTTVGNNFKLSESIFYRLPMGAGTVERLAVKRALIEVKGHF